MAVINQDRVSVQQTATNHLKDARRKEKSRTNSTVVPGSPGHTRRAPSLPRQAGEHLYSGDGPARHQL